MKKKVLTKIRKISAVYLNLTAKVLLTTISSHNEFSQLIKSYFKIIQKLMVEDFKFLFCAALNPVYKIWVKFKTKLKNILIITFIAVFWLIFECTGIYLAEFLIFNFVFIFSQLQLPGLWPICTFFSQPCLVTLNINRYAILKRNIIFTLSNFFCFFLFFGIL